MLDGLQEILFTLRRNKLRTVLTAFGVFWGIFMLILLLGFGRGMQNGVMEDFGSEPLDIIILWAGDTSVAYRGMGLGRKIRLEDSDIEAIRRQVKGVRTIAGMRSQWGATISYNGKNSNAQMHGIPDEYFRVKDALPFPQGRRTNGLDIDETRKVVALGTIVVERLFDKGVDPIGKQVRVKDVVMTVTGVFHDQMNQGRASEAVFIPQSTFDTVYGGGGTLGNIWLRPEPGVDGFELEKNIVTLVKRRHDVSPDDKRGVGSFNMAEPAKQINGLFTGISVFIWFVGLGTLTAGIVGISNIMIITVKERTREIGIRKALGATPFAIVSTLLLESTLVTSVAGYLGLVFGVGLLEFFSWLMRSTGAKIPYITNPEVNFEVAITAIILLVIVGLIAGLVPALRAAKITPIEAMKAE
jgi:putative ABC transport system permease protein